MPLECDFDTLFAFGFGIDLLCVFSSGHYPGINDEDNDVEGAKEDSSLPPTAVAPPTPPLAVDEEEMGLTFEEVIDDTFDPTCPDNEAHSGIDKDSQDVDLDACNIMPTPSSPQSLFATSSYHLTLPPSLKFAYYASVALRLSIKDLAT
ncbi:hypothetical protein BS17DRAFT_813284 [Gyrodon lividus]|nr:hypothetical protein BS17DRAFT_813284 [Gyrodon lividus]